MKLHLISENEYEDLEDIDKFGGENDSYTLWYAKYDPGDQITSCGSYDTLTAAEKQAQLLANFAGRAVEVTYGDEFEQIEIVEPIRESNEYKDLEDVDEFAEIEWDIVYELKLDGYHSTLILYQNNIRPELYEIGVWLNQINLLPWDEIPNEIIKDLAVMFGIKNLNQSGLREKTLKTIWEYMLKHKEEWEIPMPTDSLFVPYLMGQD